MDKQARPFSLQASKNALSSLGYSLRRLLAHESAWIAHFPEYEEKATVGLALGYTATALEAITNRIREQNSIDIEYISRSPEMVAAFNSAAKKRNLGQIQEFMAEATSFVLKQVKQLAKNVDQIQDQPTVEMLHTVRKSLENKSSLLGTWGKKDSGNFSDIDHKRVADKWAIDTSVPIVLDNPGRPSILKQSDENTLIAPAAALLETNDGIRRFVHFIYADIEIAAAEICARNIVQYGPLMPIQFSYDMARQCSDEARHAVMAKNMLDKYGGKLGDFTYKNHIWGAYLQGGNLAEKLAIEQIIGEGNGLDTTEASLAVMREKGLADLTRYYEYLQADETVHCAFGNRWINYLVNGNQKAFIEIVDSALEKTGGTVPGPAPVSLPVRRAAGFSETFISERLLGRTFD